MGPDAPFHLTDTFKHGLDEHAVKVVKRLLAAGHETFLVGGCVRDLCLGRRPKDFDVATSATPEAIRRLFRNSRVIGRRFKLVHVFFDSKIIETSTFRTAPPDEGGEDLLITTDNEWGTVEDDARRRDFTVNGLFYDVETHKIVDFVGGLDDLDTRIIRTIGDPVRRFREDPVRMIRAIKFAARLGFEFDPATWDALQEVAPDINKCSKARLLEEIYKLLRGGSSRRCFTLLLESQLLQAMMPSYVAQFGEDLESAKDVLLAALRTRPDEWANGGAPEVTRTFREPASTGTPRLRRDLPADDAKDAAPATEPAVRLQRFLTALDDYSLQTSQAAANGVLQAVLFAPLLGDDLVRGDRQTLDRAIDEIMNPVGNALGIARRDRELARQILMAHRRMIEPANRRRRASLSQREYFHDALIFLGMAVQAMGDGGSELRLWQQMARGPRDVPETDSTNRTKRRRRTGRKRRKEPPHSGRRSGSSSHASQES